MGDRQRRVAAGVTTPTDLKRIVAIGLTLTAGLINLIWMPIPAALAWLPVLLFVKILTCFLLPEAPTHGPRRVCGYGEKTAEISP
jgi:hypothetical protein